MADQQYLDRLAVKLAADCGQRPAAGGAAPRIDAFVR